MLSPMNRTRSAALEAGPERHADIEEAYQRAADQSAANVVAFAQQNGLSAAEVAQAHDMARAKLNEWRRHQYAARGVAHE